VKYRFAKCLRIKKILCLSIQVQLNGLTGKISFDSRGLRTDYQLDVIELSYNTLPHKVY